MPRFRDYAAKSLREGRSAKAKRKPKPSRDTSSRKDPSAKTKAPREDLTKVPTTPLTGDVKKAGYSGAGIAGIVRDTPTVLINPALKQLGLGQYGGMGDLLASMANPDQLDTLYALSNAKSGSFGGGPNDQGNFFIDFYKNLAGGQKGLPSPRQLLGGVFEKGATKPGNPFFGLVTGGTPAQQLAQFTNTVGDVTALSGTNPLVRRALSSSLNALGRNYASDQGQVKGGNTAFVNYLQKQSPLVSGFLGAGGGGGGNDGGGNGGGGGGNSGHPGNGGHHRPGGGGQNAGRNPGGGAGGRGGRNPAGHGGGGMGRFADFRQRAARGGRGGGGQGGGGGRNDGVAQRAIRDVFRGNPNIDRNAARQALRGSSPGGSGGGRSSASASGGTVRMGNVDPGAKLTINASAGKAYSSGTKNRSSGGGQETVSGGKTATSVGGREPLGPPQPRPGTSFQTYASMNTPYTRPAPRYDVPGYQNAADQWQRQTTSILDGRSNAWMAATQDYQNNLANYERVLQQAQQSRVSNPLNADFDLYRQRGY